MTLTKKAARELAGRTLRSGYFRVGQVDARVGCVYCRDHNLPAHDAMLYAPFKGRTTMLEQLTRAYLDCDLNANYQGAQT